MYIYIFICIYKCNPKQVEVKILYFSHKFLSVHTHVPSSGIHRQTGPGQTMGTPYKLLAGAKKRR